MLSNQQCVVVRLLSKLSCRCPSASRCCRTGDFCRSLVHVLCAASGRPKLFSDGPTMFNALSSVVGYLNAEGYCNSDKCHVGFLCSPCVPLCV